MKKVRRTLATLAAATALVVATATPAQAEWLPPAYQGVDVVTHLANVGWTGYAGTRGEARQLEAIGWNSQARICMRAHVTWIGWQPWICNEPGQWAYIGTTGLGAPIESVEVTSDRPVQVSANLSWTGLVSTGWGNTVTVGTPGWWFTRLESFAIRVA
jgi:hypothetical protein